MHSYNLSEGDLPILKEENHHQTSSVTLKDQYDQDTGASNYKDSPNEIIWDNFSIQRTNIW